MSENLDRALEVLSGHEHQRTPDDPRVIDIELTNGRRLRVPMGSIAWALAHPAVEYDQGDYVCVPYDDLYDLWAEHRGEQR